MSFFLVKKGAGIQCHDQTISSLILLLWLLFAVLYPLRDCLSSWANWIAELIMFITPIRGTKSEFQFCFKTLISSFRNPPIFCCFMIHVNEPFQFQFSHDNYCYRCNIVYCYFYQMNSMYKIYLFWVLLFMDIKKCMPLRKKAPFRSLFRLLFFNVTVLYRWIILFVFALLGHYWCDDYKSWYDVCYTYVLYALNVNLSKTLVQFIFVDVIGVHKACQWTS